MKALADIVSMGKALYVGLSNYPTDRALEAQKILRSFGVELLIHQPSFSMFNQWIIKDKLNVEMEKAGVGIIPFSILAQGLLTNKYIKEIPKDSRVANKDVPFLNENNITEDMRSKLVKLNELALLRNQSMAQMAIAWTAQTQGITTVLLGVSRLSQLQDNLDTLQNMTFSELELKQINEILFN